MPVSDPGRRRAIDAPAVMKRIAARVDIGLAALAIVALVVRIPALTGATDYATNFGSFLFFAAVAILLLAGTAGGTMGASSGVVYLRGGKRLEDLADAESFGIRWGIVGGIYLGIAASFVLGSDVGAAVTIMVGVTFLLVLFVPDRPVRGGEGLGMRLGQIQEASVPGGDRDSETPETVPLPPMEKPF